MHRRPFLVLGIASFLTALFIAVLPQKWLWLGFVIGGAAALSGFMLYRYRFGKIVIGAAIAVVLVTASLFAKITYTVMPQLALADQTVTVAMRIEDSEMTSSGAAYVVRVEEGGVARGTRLFLWAGDVGIEPKVGDLLTGHVVLTAARPADAAVYQYAAANNTWLYAWPADGYALMWEDGRDSMNTAVRILTVCREHIRDLLYRYLPPERAALCESVIMGERDRLDEAMSDRFRVCGVYHLLAVSGLHMTIITGAVLGMTRCLPRRLSAIISMAATLLFMALCGFAPSVTRAGVMMLIVLSGRLFRRRADGLNSLGAAAFLMLIVDPLCAYDIGWQLSFSATCGLFTAFPVWQRVVTAKAIERLPYLSWVLSPCLSAAGVTLCASWATLPLLALYFGEISTVFLPCNLICVPLMTVLLVLALIGVLVATVWPSVGIGFLVLAERLSDWLDAVTTWVATWPQVTIQTTHPLVIAWLFAFVIITAIMCAWRGPRSLVRVSAILCGVLVLGVTVYQVYDRHTVRVTVVGEDTPAVIVESPGGTGVLFAGDADAAEATADMLDREHITQLDWALWTDTSDTRRCEQTFDGVTISRLLYDGDVADYRALPAAQTQEMLTNTSITLTADTTLAAENGMYRLETAGLTVLFCRPDADGAQMDDAWRQADLLVLSRKIPSAVTDIAADTAVVCCSPYTATDSRERMPAHFATVYYTAEQDDLYFLSRQKGELTLRAY